MTRDDIIEMAQSVLLLDFRDNPNDEGIAQFIGTLSDFAELVAAAERKACAEHYLGIMREAIKEEREACAKVAEAQGTSSGDRIAEAIRARSTACGSDS
jgi:hypothetical protein